jgi:hypothetical protein
MVTRLLRDLGLDRPRIALMLDAARRLNPDPFHTSP